MSLWDTLKRILCGGGAAGRTTPAGKPGASSRAAAADPDGLRVYFRCGNCGSPVAVRVNKRNDLSREEGGPGTMFVRKEVMDNKCFRLMHAEIWLDDAYRIVTADIEGGTLLTADEYEALRNPQP
ncbi:MAG: hypothetical protein ABFD20_03085 [Anaerolineales bacterium]